ncbi:LysR family transcriptional regulator [Hydrogenophaga pseudoflava]|uniref:LysR family transcriptional regulator n=1 Tax=Hydrogenophaga pseudoflava TaxID=47421 RepID=UPI0027E429E7|nr:LysR family transcriptional regulator [Hydrogenophaga pseudoflava]MDQ7743086.1 LysR family transcriptional regulator [Hydrogenophaga pseudoflava]
MDKLRALHYFVVAAEEGSFSATARRFDVSVPAVTKLIGALERELGARLIDRSTHGLRLTARGEAYRDMCAPLLGQLARADRVVSDRAGVEERTLVVGVPPLLSRAVLVPALPAFRERFAHVQIELKPVNHLTVTDAEARGMDVLVALGWPGALDFIQVPLARSRLIVCASPAYWRQHPPPRQPAGLNSHACVLVRSPEGTVLDLWRHHRGDTVEEVTVRGWLTCGSRDDALQAVLLGHGVGRFADLSVWHHVRDGQLEPVLTDWDSGDSPPFHALVRPDGRRDPDVQGFVSFLARLLQGIEAECMAAIGPRTPNARPDWYGKGVGRASTRGS